MHPSEFYDDDIEDNGEETELDDDGDSGNGTTDKKNEIRDEHFGRRIARIDKRLGYAVDRREIRDAKGGA